MGRRFRVYTQTGNVYEFEAEIRDGKLVFKSIDDSKTYECSVIEKSRDKYIVKIGDDEIVVTIMGDNIYVNNTPLLVTGVTELVQYSDTSRSIIERREPVVKKTRDQIIAPISGKIIELKVREGDVVNEGDVVALMVSMKMVIEIKSDVTGVVEKILVEPGKAVMAGQAIIKVKPLEKK